MSYLQRTEYQALHDVDDNRCPLCGGSSTFAFVAEDRNRRISAETFCYRCCKACGTIFMINVPSDLGRYYAAGYHPFDDHGEPNWRRDAGLLAAEAWRIEMIRGLANGGTLVDVGAGAGGFVAAAQKAGFDVTAIEMDSDCCRYMENRLAVNTICTDQLMGALHSLASARVVTFWHVLEHLQAPGDVLAAASQVLEPGGVLALAVPNPQAVQFRLLHARWAHLDAPRHLCLMSPSAILRKAVELGLEVVNQTTNDPSGLACNLHGWIDALRKDPSQGAPGMAALTAGRLIASVVGKVEKHANRGAALTIFLRKPGTGYA